MFTKISLIILIKIESHCITITIYGFKTMPCEEININRRVPYQTVIIINIMSTNNKKTELAQEKCFS